MPITDYHRAIFDFLESYRAEHPEANLTYSLRQKQGKKNGRLRNLYLFTGTDNYISIGLYAPVSNNNKTRTISIYADYDLTSDALKNCTLAIVFSDEKLAAQASVYQEIIQQIGPEQFKEYSHNRYELYYKDPDWRVNLQTYLEQHKPIIDRVIQRAGVANLFHIPGEELESAIEVANQSTPVEDSEDVNYWVFQGKPDQFQNHEEFDVGTSRTWRVAKHRQRIKPGDKIILWQTGPQAGCYALAEVASEVQTGANHNSGQNHQNLDEDNEQWVDFKVLIALWEQPVMKTDLEKIPAFTGFNGSKQGTNFTATSEQYGIIEKMVTHKTEETLTFWKYSPGKQNERWEKDLRDQVMAISFPNYDTGPLDQYKTKKDLDEHLNLSNNPNQTRNLFEFKDAAIGDVVLANEGVKKVMGIGIITGPYQYQENAPYPHYRSVHWLAEQPLTYTPYDVTGYPELFKNDTFSRSRIGTDIIELYVRQYPQFRPVFEQYGLLKPGQFPALNQPMPSLHPKNIILYGPPGTGKTYGTIDLAVDIVDGRKSPDHKVNKPRFDQLRKEGQIEFITFHQSYTYEDFVIGLKPDVEKKKLKFKLSYGIFYNIAKLARDNYTSLPSPSTSQQLRPFEEVYAEYMAPLLESGKAISVRMASGIMFQIIDLTEKIQLRTSDGGTNNTLSKNTLKQIYQGEKEAPSAGLGVYYRPLIGEMLKLSNVSGTDRTAVSTTGRKNYVLIIDEINRANMSRVFGELITLLEDDKRLGADNELTVTLPSGESFAVPPNLYLIGTMNTADKSLALLDIALRRRFDFQYQRPNPDLLGSPAKEILTKLNKAIRDEHKPADFLIGHAYFIGKTQAQLPEVFNNRVIPLLMEYFNGKAATVIKLLDKAGVTATLDEITDEITVDNVG